MALLPTMLIKLFKIFKRRIYNYLFILKNKNYKNKINYFNKLIKKKYKKIIKCIIKLLKQ